MAGLVSLLAGRVLTGLQNECGAFDVVLALQNHVESKLKRCVCCCVICAPRQNFQCNTLRASCHERLDSEHLSSAVCIKALTDKRPAFLLFLVDLRPVPKNASEHSYFYSLSQSLSDQNIPSFAFIVVVVP